MKKLTALLAFVLIAIVLVLPPASADNPAAASRIRYGSALPSTCRASTGDVFIKTGVSPTEFYWCSATDTWTLIGTGTLANNSVTNAKLADMATQTFKGRTTAGTGDPEDLTAAQATALLNVFVGDSGSGGTKGLVPAPGSGDAAAGKFLKADGTFAVPSGSGAPADATYITQTANGTLSNEQALGSLATGLLKNTTTTGVLSVADADAVSAPAFCSDAGSNDTYACNLSPAPSGYTTGTHYRFKAATSNTGAATVNFNSLGAKTIKKAEGGITTDLSDNDIRAGQWVDLVYDGTNMQVQSNLGNAASGGGLSGLTSGRIPYASSSTTIADSPLERVDANTVRQINGTTAQTFQIYQTTTNSQRFEITPSSNNITFQQAGSATGLFLFRFPGPCCGINIGANESYPNSDGGHNWGKSGNRWNGVFAYGGNFQNFVTIGSNVNLQGVDDGKLTLYNSASNNFTTLRFGGNAGVPGISKLSSTLLAVTDANNTGTFYDWQARGVQFSTGTRPTCNSTNRGFVWYVAGGAGVADTFEVCRKDASDSYAWVTLF